MGGNRGPRRERRRLFTLAEANALLPELVPILESLRETKARLIEARDALSKLTPAMRSNGYGMAAVGLERRVGNLVATLTRGIERVASLGVELKDVDQGLIDFPSRREGRIVLLCWRLGEGELAYWHEPDEGFAGRQPL